ncbi:MAG: aminotransferase class I/II-fold pyridoxal phosphate-dependent enzyme [Actinomycetota bacterium]|nr:aminotransferase class I/II-fold pyridoxal phosphate-dependent enzyme [Actinomycetota bacterium]
MAVSGQLMRELDALGPFLEGMMDPELSRYRGDPEACDFLAGNPEIPALPGYVEALQGWAVPRHRAWFAYNMPDRGAQESAARGLSAELGLDVDPDDILLTRGAHGALAMALHLVVDPADEVIFISPPWFFYEALVIGVGATPVRVRADMETFDLDLEAIERALSARTRAILINTPNNPTGRIYPPETLERLASMLRAHSVAVGRPIYLVSDESYSRVLFDGNTMQTPGRFYDRSLLVHTYSKSALAPGQRLGFLTLTPTMPDRTLLRRGYLAAAFATSNGLPDAIMQYALPDLEHIVLDMKRIELRRDRMLEALRQMGYDVHTPEATFYLLPRSPIDDDVAFARRLARDKVIVLPGRACEMPGYFRISLTATDEMVDRALPLFERAIRDAAT